MEDRKKMLPGVAILIVFAIVLYYGMIALEPALLAKPKLFGYIEWALSVPKSIKYKLFWVLGDFTEACAFRSILAGIGLIAGCITAHLLCRHKPQLKIYSISMGLGNLPWILVAATVGLLTSLFTYSWFFNISELWIPTFLPGCTLPAVIVVMYGGGWKTSLTGGILAGLIQFPFGFAAFLLAIRLGLPPLVFLTVLGICVAGIITFEILRLLPWMKGLVNGSEIPKMSPYEGKQPILPEPKIGWIFRRSITDQTELSFFGSEIVGACIIIGAFATWFLNPSHLCSGIPFLFPAILSAQIMTSALCSFLYFDKWKKFGFYPQFSAVIGASVCVMQFGTGLLTIIVAVLLNTLITAPLSNIALGFMMQKIKRYPAMCGLVVLMGAGIGAVAIIMRIMVYIGLLPALPM